MTHFQKYSWREFVNQDWGKNICEQNINLSNWYILFFKTVLNIKFKTSYIYLKALVKRIYLQLICRI